MKGSSRSGLLQPFLFRKKETLAKRKTTFALCKKLAKNGERNPKELMVKKMRPKLIVDYSGVYERQIHKWRGEEYTDRFKEMMAYTKKLQKKWDTVGDKAFDTMSRVSGLAWQKPLINCWVARRSNPFSMPLTIPPRKDFDKLLEVIIHELVHNLIVQNSDRIKKGYSKRYADLSKLTRIHILVHAILHETLLELYGEKQTKIFIQDYDRLSADYRKAWDVVEKEGAKKIIKECIKK